MVTDYRCSPLGPGDVPIVTPMLITATHFTAFDGDGVPEWVRLMPLGVFRPANAADKRGPFDLTDPAAVIEATAPFLPLLVDEDHVSLVNGAAAPARGWIDALEARADGLYGHVEWTDAGRALMGDKAYRGFSPVFLTGAHGVVTRITGAAITNNPALPDLNLFTHKPETTMDLVALRRLLGLSDTADEAAILARVTENASAVSAHAAGLSALAAVAGVTGATPDALFTALRSRVAASADVTALTGTVQRLETELTTLRQTGAQAAAVALVDGAIRALKPINALREIYIARAVNDLAGVRAELDLLPSIGAGGTVVPHDAGGGGDVATTTQSLVAAQMGIPVEKLIAAAKARTAIDGRTA
jgi:phage I-like protein